MGFLPFLPISDVNMMSGASAAIWNHEAICLRKRPRELKSYRLWVLWDPGLKPNLQIPSDIMFS